VVRWRRRENLGSKWVSRAFGRPGVPGSFSVSSYACAVFASTESSILWPPSGQLGWRSMDGRLDELIREVEVNFQSVCVLKLANFITRSVYPTVSP
jgi:hypothetical protein